MGGEREIKRILVTGGAGFIGSHICHRLLDEGCSVIAFDNLLTGSIDNIASLLGHPRFEFQHYDVTNFLYIDGGLDAILHFASPASPADFERLPIEILKVGSIGTHKALGLAKAKNARLLLASTSECYGDPEVNPQPETYWGNVNPIGIRGVYDEAKRFAEAMTMAYHRHHGVDVRGGKARFGQAGFRGLAEQPHRVVDVEIVLGLPIGRLAIALQGEARVAAADTRIGIDRQKAGQLGAAPREEPRCFGGHRRLVQDVFGHGGGQGQEPWRRVGFGVSESHGLLLCSAEICVAQRRNASAPRGLHARSRRFVPHLWDVLANPVRC